MATDAELVRRVQSGESEAYAELFRRHYQHIYAICVSLVRNTHDAEELAQEMFVLAYLKVDQLRDPARFFPWLRKMARNRSRNFVQREKDNVIPSSLVDTERPDEHVLRQELIQAIMEAIEALPEKDRQVVRAHIDGLSHAEISRRFDISYRSSLSRLYRSRKKLADRLKGLYGILGLARLKGIISGGIVAMKIGTGVKVTIGVIGVLAAGFIGLKMANHSDVAQIPEMQTPQPVAASKVDHKVTIEPKTPIDSAVKGNEPRELPRADEQDQSDAEAFLAWLDSVENSSTVQPVEGEKQEEDSAERKEIYNGMTREEVEAKLAEVDEEIYRNYSIWGTLYTEVMEITQGRKPCPPGTTAKEMWDEAVRAYEYASDLIVFKRHQYAKALGLDLGEPFRPGGWAYELTKHTSRRHVVQEAK